MNTRLDSYWKIYQAKQELIRFADTKATAILAVDGVIAGLYFSNIDTIKTVLQHDFTASIPLVATMGFILISIIASALCIIPRLKSTSNCPIYFCDIATNYKNADEYQNAMKKKKPKDMQQALLSQIYIISKIAKKKHSLVQWVVIFFVKAIIASTIFAILVIF